MQQTIFRTLCLSAVLFGIGAGVVSAQGTFVPETVSDVPPDPEIERQSFKVTDGFEVNLWAADPLLAKPIQMNWDAQGRLWVASSSMYPQIKPGEAPTDKVIVLEDADNDGKADQAKVFADGLLIPTGVVPGDGGAYVANSTEIIHLKDTNNDGKADQRRIVLSGFSTEDTHHIVHTFRWGNDGRLYFNQSIYIHSHLETPWGTKRLMGSGIWRFRPENYELDIFARGMVNPWGHAIDRYGQSFSTDGAGGEGIYYTFPGSAFQTAKAWDGFADMERIMQGMNPGSPKYCGLEIVTGRHLPDDWQGNAITNDFRANRVVRYQIVDENGTFVSKQMPDVITSKDVAFRPIDVKMGPDGAIYIADWYNPIINHGEVDFRDKRRDKTHGRIWRLTAKGRPLVKRPTLVGAPVGEVLAQLNAPEEWTRHQAKLVLRSLGANAVLPALKEHVAKLNDDDQKLEALWVYQTLDTPVPTLLDALQKSKTPQVRAAAMRVAGDWISRLPDVMAGLKAGVNDENPRVRLEAVRTLARVGTADAFALAISARSPNHPADPSVDYALWTTTNELLSVWIPAFHAGKLSAEQAKFAVQSISSPSAKAELVKPLKGEQVLAVPEDFVGGFGSAEQVGILWQAVQSGSSDPAKTVRQMKAVRQAAVRGVRPPTVDETDLAKLIAKPGISKDVLRESILLAGAWKSTEAIPALAKLATAADTAEDLRKSTLEALAEYGPAAADAARKLDVADRPFEIRAVGIATLVASDVKDAANRAASLLSEAKPGADTSTLFAAFLQRDGGADALAAALESKKLDADVAKIALRYVGSSGRDNPVLSQRLRDLAGIGAGAQTLTPEQMASTMKEVQEKGDAARGELVFRRADMSCFQCHAIGGAGSILAPDLRAIGASSPIDYLIDSLINPGKAVKDGYESTIIATTKGETFSGIKVSRDDKQIVLRDATHPAITIPIASIRKERAGGSLMPTGLADLLTRGEFLDLIKFMSELGKPGPYGPDTALLIRRWRVMDAKSLPPANAIDPSAAGLTWIPAYSFVSGELPMNVMTAGGKGPFGYATGEIDVATAGKISLHLSDAKGVSLWVDGKPVEVKPEIALDLTRGTHLLAFKVEAAQKGIRVEVRDVPGSGGHAQPVGGP